MTATKERPSRYDELEVARIVDLFIDADCSSRPLDGDWVRDLLTELAFLLEILGEDLSAKACRQTMGRVDFDPELGEKFAELEENSSVFKDTVERLLDGMHGDHPSLKDAGSIEDKLEVVSGFEWVQLPADFDVEDIKEVLNKVGRDVVEIPEGWTVEEARKTLTNAAKRRKTKESKA